MSEQNNPFSTEYPDLHKILWDDNGQFQPDRIGEAIEHLQSLKLAAPLHWINLYRLFTNYGLHRPALSVMQQYCREHNNEQLLLSEHVHKGLPHCLIGDSYLALNYPWHAQRHYLLAFVDDVLYDGKWDRKGRAAWQRLTLYFGFSEQSIDHLASEALSFKESHPTVSRFPEIVVSLHQRTLAAVLPAAQEYMEQPPLAQFVAHMLKIKDGKSADKLTSGDSLTYLAASLCSTLPGCRVLLVKKRPKSVEYDVSFAQEGFPPDYRASWGNYVACECKDYKEPVGVGYLAQLILRMESTRTSTAILFASRGISGKKSGRDSQREILKLVQRSGKSILVVDRKDLTAIAEGKSFLSILREKHEALVFDLH